MPQFKKWISQEGREAVEEAVARAELKTSAEIVPVVLLRSSTVGHVWPLLTLTFLVLLVLSPWWVSLGESWDSALAERTMSVVFVGVLAFYGAKLKWVQAALTSSQDKNHQVDLRAETIFLEKIVSQGGTQGNTGVLLVLSLMERRSVLLAEESVNHHFGPETWVEILDHLSANAKKDGLEKAFVKAIDELGDILAEKLPVQANDKNEVKNHLILLES